MTTLNSYAIKPLFKQRDYADIELERVRARIKTVLPDYKKSAPMPERDAVLFYMLNHAYSIIRASYHPDEHLSADVVKVCDAYVAVANAALARLYTYLMLITTRESRHVHSGGSLEAHADKYPTEWAFTKTITGTGSDGAVSRFLAHQFGPEVKLARYAQHLEDMFNTCSWSGGYGGKAWGQVANALRQYLTGTFSGEMLLDTAYTLAHNNGPIFNKGMCFKNYGHAIIPMLDVQRAGMIPGLVHDFNEGRDYLGIIGPEHVALWKLCQSAVGGLTDDFVTPVDWWVVEALGAMSNVGKFKTAQQNYGVASAGSEAAAAAAAEKYAAKQEKLAKLKSKVFALKPGVNIDKVKREELT